MCVGINSVYSQDDNENIRGLASGKQNDGSELSTNSFENSNNNINKYFFSTVLCNKWFTKAFGV